MITRISVIRNHKSFEAYLGMPGFACPNLEGQDTLANLYKDGEFNRTHRNRSVVRLT